MKSEVKGLSSILLATFIYSTFGVFTRIIGFNLDFFYAGFTRSVLIVLVMLPFLFLADMWKRVRNRDWVWIIPRAFFGSMVAFVGFYYAFYNLTFGTAYFIFYAGATLGGYFLGFLLFSERLAPKKILALALAVAGLLTIYAANFDLGSPFYMGLALVGGCGSASWNTFSKKVSGSYSALQLNFLDMFFTGIFFLVGSLVMRETWTIPVLDNIWAANMLFTFAFIATGQLVIWGFKSLEAQIASIVLLAEIIFGIIFGYLFFQEILPLSTIVGGGLIVAAIIVPELHVFYAKRRSVKI
jgi:drug/metabolite transporter (DMT)-like permease